MAKKPKISQDEVDLFRQEVGDVARLRHDKIVHRKRRPPPVPKQSLLELERIRRDMLSDAVEAADIESGEELVYRRPGVQEGVMRKLRRGQYAVGAELDLHGMRVSDARQALAAFLQRCRAADTRCVRIIHGKGLGSPNELPILKGKLAQWLVHRNEVLAFCSARQVDGGTGAVYVLLKTR